LPASTTAVSLTANSPIPPNTAGGPLSLAVISICPKTRIQSAASVVHPPKTDSFLGIEITPLLIYDHILQILNISTDLRTFPAKVLAKVAS
jgi:hypothetical protein